MTYFPAHYPTVAQVQENTLFKDALTAQAALETLLWLDAGAPHKFDGLEGVYSFSMGCFIETEKYRSSYITNRCGTSCCIAGAIELFRKDGIKNVDVAFGSLGGRELDSSFNIEGATFKENLESRQELADLFYVRSNGKAILYTDEDGYTDEEFDINCPTTDEATRVLYKYLTTGTVDWQMIADARSAANTKN